MLIVFTTTADKNEAESLAEKIVNEKLAACVQIMPSVTSVYFWNGKVVKENENLILIKTLHENYAKLESFIKDNHSYDTPEIVAVKSEHISKEYHGWIKDYLAE